jgi:cyanophycin synthetase
MSAAAGVQAVKAALAIVARNASGGGADAASSTQHIRVLKQICEQEHPQYQTLIGAAKRRGIPFLKLAGSTVMWQFGWGSRSELFRETSPNADGMVSFLIAGNKMLAKRLFQDIGIPTPAGIVMSEGQSLRAAADLVGWPCVAKPLDLGGGKGVTADISDLAGLERAAAIARSFSPNVLIEAHVPGFDHRLMVIDGRLVAAVRREPPEVVGDGTSSIRALIANFNAARRALPKAACLYQVRQDEAVIATLERQQLSLDTVVPKGRRVALRSNANLSTGGTAYDVTDKVHPLVRGMAERLASAIGLRSTGIDYLTTDISRSPEETGGAVIEVNTTPGIDVLAAAGLDFNGIGSLILGDLPGRIPVQLLVTDSSAMSPIFEQLSELGRHEDRALVTPHRGLVGGVPIAAESMTPVQIVEAALRHRSVTALTIVWDVETLARWGLPVDRLERTILLSAEPPQEWAELLGRLSSELTEAKSVKQAVRRLS